jgi:hypothetical protein
LPEILAAVKQKKFSQLIFDWSQELGPIYVYWIRYPTGLFHSKWRQYMVNSIS